LEHPVFDHVSITGEGGQSPVCYKFFIGLVEISPLTLWSWVWIP